MGCGVDGRSSGTEPPSRGWSRMAGFFCSTEPVAVVSDARETHESESDLRARERSLAMCLRRHGQEKRKRKDGVGQRGCVGCGAWIGGYGRWGWPKVGSLVMV